MRQGSPKHESCRIIAGKFLTGIGCLEAFSDLITAAAGATDEARNAFARFPSHNTT